MVNDKAKSLNENSNLSELVSRGSWMFFQSINAFMTLLLDLSANFDRVELKSAGKIKSQDDLDIRVL